MAAPPTGALRRVQSDASLACPARLRHELVPVGQPSSDLSLRQLEEQHRDGLAELLEVGELDQSVGISDERRVQTVEPLVAAFLVELEMARGMERERANPAPVGPDAGGDLLRHRSARHEHR